MWAAIPLKSKWKGIIGIERRCFETCGISNLGKVSGGMRKIKVIDAAKLKRWPTFPVVHEVILNLKTHPLDYIRLSF